MPAASWTRGTGGDASTRQFHRLGLAGVSAHRPTVDGTNGTLMWVLR